MAFGLFGITDPESGDGPIEVDYPPNLELQLPVPSFTVLCLRCVFDAVSLEEEFLTNLTTLTMKLVELRGSFSGADIALQMGLQLLSCIAFTSPTHYAAVTRAISLASPSGPSWLELQEEAAATPGLLAPMVHTMLDRGASIGCRREALRLVNVLLGGLPTTKERRAMRLESQSCGMEVALSLCVASRDSGLRLLAMEYVALREADTIQTMSQHDTVRRISGGATTANLLATLASSDLENASLALALAQARRLIYTMCAHVCDYDMLSVPRTLVRRPYPKPKPRQPSGRVSLKRKQCSSRLLWGVLMMIRTRWTFRGLRWEAQWHGLPPRQVSVM